MVLTMKKALSIGIFIMFVFVLYQWGVTYFKKEHKIEYTYKSLEKTFQITESFRNNQYLLKIETEGKSFLVTAPNQFQKNKKIINDILYEEENDTLCIFPIYPKETTDTIYCNNGKIQTSYEMNKNTSAVQRLEARIKEKGYQKEEKEVKEMEIRNRSTFYYKDDSEYFTFWDYNGYYVLNGEAKYKMQVTDFDRYENTLSTLIGPFYISPVYRDPTTNEITGFQVLNVTTNKNLVIPLENQLSNSTYINGVVDDRLYLFDPNHLLQIEINPKENKARIVGNKEENAQDYNGSFETRNIYDFVNQKITFTTNIEKEFREKYALNEFKEGEQAVYFIEGNQIYQVYKEYPETKILLLEMNGIKELLLAKDQLYFISGDTLYRYTKNDNLEKVIVSNEFHYNYKNVISVYLK